MIFLNKIKKKTLSNIININTKKLFNNLHKINKYKFKSLSNLYKNNIYHFHFYDENNKHTLIYGLLLNSNKVHTKSNKLGKYILINTIILNEHINLYLPMDMPSLRF